jgi:hypothetical protein
MVGTSNTRTGVNGQSTDGNGMIAHSTNNVGLIASSSNSTGLRAVSSGNGDSRGLEATNINGVAIYAVSGKNYGGRFSGGKAPLMLEPSSSVSGPPTTGTHTAGEFFVDKYGRLFYCYLAGTPGQWQQIAGLSHI